MVSQDALLDAQIHLKGRNQSIYRKVDVRLWLDAKFLSLTDRGKLVFLMLLTNPAMTALGAMRQTLAGMGEELGWEPEDFRNAFRESLLKRMVEHDPKACLIALPNFLRYNQPESPNVVRAWGKSAARLPECKLKNRVIARSKAFIEDMSEGFQKAFEEAFGEAVAKGMPNQEQRAVNCEQDTDYHPPQATDEIQTLIPSKEKRPSTRKKGAQAIELGVYPAEMLKAITLWRELLRFAGEQKGRFPKEQWKYVASGIGAKEAIHRAWASRVGSKACGSVLTPQDVLAALSLFVSEKRLELTDEDTPRLAVPMLSTVLNSDLFSDALVAIKEVPDAG